MAARMHLLGKDQKPTEVIVKIGKSLMEIYDLMEMYGPQWCPEEVHKRARSALALIDRSLASKKTNHLRNETGMSRTRNVRRNRAAA